MPELELQYILLCAKRTVCDDNKNIRLRRHLRIVGPKSTGKTTQTCKFVRDLTGAVPYGSVSGKSSKPTYLEIGGGSTWEPIRGGAHEGELLMPMLHDVDYLLCGELTAFIDSSEQGKRRISHMNEMLEEGVVTLTQMGIRGIKPAKKAAFAEACRLDGRVKYNEDKGIISYPVRAVFTCASWPLGNFDKKLAAICESTGFDSRMHHSIYDPSEEQDKIHRKDQHGEPNTAVEGLLRRFNEYAWRSRFAALDAPKPEMIQRIVAYYYEEYERINQMTDVPISKYAGDRDYVDAAQLLVAFAMVRRLSEAFDEGVEPTFESLDYTEDDVRAVCNFRREHLLNAEKLATESAREDPLRDTVRMELIEFAKTKLRPVEDFVSDSLWREQEPPLIDTVELNHFITTGGAGKPYSRQTAHNHISKMRKCGYLSLLENKKNMLADNIAEALGPIRPTHEQGPIPEDHRFPDYSPEDDLPPPEAIVDDRGHPAEEGVLLSE